MKLATRWLWLLIPSAAIAVFLTGCSRYYDAWIVNPCGEELRVETFSSPPERIGRYPAERSVSIPPQSIFKVDEAFTDAGGFEWTVRIVERDTLVPVDGRKWIHDTVLLPPESCVVEPAV